MIVAFAKRKWSAWSFFSFLSSFLPYLVRLSFGFGARLRLISIFQPSKEEKGIPLLLFLFFCLRPRNLCFLFLFFYLCFFLAARAERSLVTHPFSLILSCPGLHYLTLPAYPLTHSILTISFILLHYSHSHSRSHSHTQVTFGKAKKDKTRNKKRKHIQNNKRSGRAKQNALETKSGLFFFHFSFHFFIKSWVFFFFTKLRDGFLAEIWAFFFFFYDICTFFF